MYEKDGEKYFVVDSHMHYWNAAPDNWVPGAEQYAKGWIECFHAYQGLGPPETHWTIEHFQKYSEDDLMKDVFEDGHVDVAIFQPTYLKEWYKEGFNTTERNAEMGQQAPRQVHLQHPTSTPGTATRAWRSSGATWSAYGSKGVKLYTAEWNNGSRGWKLSDPGGLPLPGGGAGARDQEHPRAQGPDDLAAGQGRVRRLRRRPRGDRLPGPELHRRARRAAADRGLLLHGHAGAQRLRRPVGGHRRPDARPAAVLRQGHGRAAVLGRRGQDDLRQRLRHLGAQVAGRGLRRLGLPRATSSPTTRGSPPRPRRRSSA